MIGLFRVASAAFFFALSSAAMAQNAGSVTNHALPIGKGPGTTGFGSLGPCTAGWTVVAAGASADPACGQLGLTNGVTGILPGANGGTNNGFMQFSGPASALKTYTLPNVNSTLAALGTIQTWTGAQSFTDGTLILLGSSSGSSTIKAPATGGGTATLFAGSDTIMGIATAQTPTNKTFNCANNTCTVRLGNDVTGQLPIANGGTNCAAASGTCLDNITGFASTGYQNRTGAGAYSFNAAATAAQYLAGTASKVVESGVIYQAETATTFGATTTFDFSTFINTAVTLTGNITTMTLSNVKAGQAGQIRFIQDGTGSRTAAWSSTFKFASGVTPTLSTAASAVDALEYNCSSASYCIASIIKDVR